MRQYKVVALSVGSGRGKKIYKSGDVVNESGFHPGIAEELVIKGFLQRIGDDQGSEVKNISLEKTLPPTHDKEVNEGDLNADKFKGEQQSEEKETIENLKTENTGPVDVGQKILDSINGSNLPKIDDITKNAIIENLKTEKIEFDYKSTKEELYKLWVDKVSKVD